MRELCGDEQEPEYDAARCLERLIVDEWGELADPMQKVSIITAAQCPGQKVHDIDLLLLIRLKQPLRIRILKSVDLELPSEVHI